MVLNCVEKWLEYSVDGSMAYFLWDDDGALQLLAKYVPDFLERYAALAANVERTDVFRILVTTHIGGIVRIIPMIFSAFFLLLFLEIYLMLPHFSQLFQALGYRNTDTI
jgi:hypothetical protein